MGYGDMEIFCVLVCVCEADVNFLLQERRRDKKKKREKEKKVDEYVHNHSTRSPFHVDINTQSSAMNLTRQR